MRPGGAMVQQVERSDIEFIDRAHDSLHALVNHLRLAVRHRKSEAHITNLKDDLKAFLNSHIEFENYIMMVNNFPLTYAHVEEHGLFRSRFDEILDRIDRQGDASEVVAEIRDLHDGHIRYFDDVLCRYLSDKYHLQEVHDGLGI